MASTDNNTSTPEMVNTIQVPVCFTKEILLHHAQLQTLETKLRQVLEIQEEFINNVGRENKRYKDVNSSFDFNIMFKQVAVYAKKLSNIHSDMTMIQERIQRLKHRAQAVKDYQEVKVRELQEAKALHEERERLLTAKPVWETGRAEISDQT